MKRTPLQTRKPLRRRTPLRTRRKTKYKSRPRDLEYMAWVRRQPCAVVASIVPASRVMIPGVDVASPCSGRVEADHAGLRPMNRKAPDQTCIPLCHKHHVQRTSFSGIFRLLNKAEMRAWLDAQVALHRKLYEKRWR